VSPEKKGRSILTVYKVVDASLAIKWVLEEPLDEEAMLLADEWSKAGNVPAAPGLLLAEVTNLFHRRVVAGYLSLSSARELLKKLLSMGIEIKESPAIHLRALELAQELHLPATYDVHYLALAELLGCELWTADEKFFNSINQKKPQIRLLGAKG
jgi:predicted nucleic acid-binding protein